ncbi:hypothetical protein FS837_007458 [Tulasnella sp. UAMH 9824]|nr:hypothetical protein FS837_007458 [Tulasnella sp. UAMH 9824]
MASVAFDPSQITPPERVVDVHGIYAKHLIQDHVEEKRRRAGASLPFPSPFPPTLPPIQSIRTKVESEIGTLGILGAGVGGLYAAMILDSLGIPFEILEASGRTGGRVYTHEFSKKEHDYYDVGAMRFPDEPAMSRLFHLFRCHQLNSDGLDVNSRLIEYHYREGNEENENSFLSFNGVSVRKSQHKKDYAADIFQFSKTGVPTEDLKKGTERIIDDTFDEYVKALKKDLEPMAPGQEEPSDCGWKMLMDKDKHSVRSFMALEKKMSLPTIRWCETMDNSTDSYDKAFSEACLDIVAFGDKHTKWRRLEYDYAFL